MPINPDEEILNRQVETGDQERIMGIISQRITSRKPAAYLLGEAWFAGLPFYVNEDVLIPRSPLAELINERFSPWIRPENIKSMLDIGTGSGCIAIAAAMKFPEIIVDAVDISEKALVLALKNIRRHGLDNRVRAIRSDVFSALGGKKYDLIIANPPYVSEEEYLSLPGEYHYEPRIALQADDRGMDVVTRILLQVVDYLNANGVLIMEVGYSWEIFESKYPDIPFIWLELQHGGEGVFVITRDEIINYL